MHSCFYSILPSFVLKQLINNEELKVWDGTARARSLANIRFIGELFRLHVSILYA